MKNGQESIIIHHKRNCDSTLQPWFQKHMDAISKARFMEKLGKDVKSIG